ncbi:hypothetical protein WH47_05378 [Habropoda laboriosa]|uniref:Uncharacterized protein n=1 Tax=Habropoda laboriosa TaxID=597456 RepID=A0A0L7RKC3_9HYME|nr:hypothetical protein WH47_05378 [Habropoda laboriosa]
MNGASHAGQRPVSQLTEMNRIEQNRVAPNRTEQPEYTPRPPLADIYSTINFEILYRYLRLTDDNRLQRDCLGWFIYFVLTSLTCNHFRESLTRSM